MTPFELYVVFGIPAVLFGLAVLALKLNDFAIRREDARRSKR